MSTRPSLCPNCGNWHTPVTVPDGVVCGLCAEGAHVPHLKTGVIDCHFGQESATPSEVKMAGFLALCNIAWYKAQRTTERIRHSVKDREELGRVLGEAEQVFAQVELNQADVPNVITWASVMEMPGLKGESASKRFKNLDALRELAGNSRRPREDVTTMERSDKVCREMAAELPVLVSNARLALAEARQAAQEWKMPEPPMAEPRRLTPAERMARARAAKKSRQLVEASA